MPQSKTTIVRQKKIDRICKILGNMNYFLAHFKKSDLFLIKTKDLKKVLEITTSWKTGLMDITEYSQNSNTQGHEEHGTATISKGIKDLEK